MADNLGINTGAGGIVRTKDRTGVETQIIGIDIGIGGAEQLMDATHGMPLADAPPVITGGPTATASTVLFTQDTTGYQSLSVQLVGQFTGGVVFQVSNNNTDFVPMLGIPMVDDRQETDTLYMAGMIRLPAVGRFIRAVTNPAFVGSVAWYAYLRQQPVVVDPSIAITADPTVPLPVGGMDAAGTPRMLRTDPFGQVLLPDMLVLPWVAATVGQASAAGYDPRAMALPIIDTTGYGSLLVQSDTLYSGLNTVTFDGSMDGQTWSILSGFQVSSGVVTQGSTGIAAASTLIVFNGLPRYVRGRLATFNNALHRFKSYLRRAETSLVPANATVNLTQVNGNSIPTGNGVNTNAIRVALASDSTGPVRGAVTAGTAVSVAPVTVGGLAKTANPAARSDGQVVDALYDKLGKAVVVGSVRDLKADQFTTLTSTTTETTIVTAIASTFNDLYGLVCVNDSATACEVEFRDVAAGSVRFPLNIPAGDTRGFMLPESAAWKQASVNTAWTAKCLTSVASIKIAALYVKNL